jgi:hypothetical protein
MFTLIVFGIVLVDSYLLGFLLVLFPGRVAVDDIEGAQCGQVVGLEVGFDVDRGMVASLGPPIFFLHEHGHAGVLRVSDGGVDVFDEVLRSFAGLDVLGVEAVVLGGGYCTYLRMRLSFEKGLLIVGLLCINQLQ